MSMVVVLVQAQAEGFAQQTTFQMLSCRFGGLGEWRLKCELGGRPQINRVSFSDFGHRIELFPNRI
jgi:hypothetical protein